MTRSECKCGNIDVKDICSGPCDLPVSNLRHSACAVGMIMDRNIDGFLDCRNGLCRCRRVDHSAHVLQVNGCGTDVHIVFCSLDKGLDRVDRTRCELDISFHTFSGFQRCLCGTFTVSDIVQSVKDQEDIHSILCRLCHEFLDHVIRIRGVPQKVLTT